MIKPSQVDTHRPLTAFVDFEEAMVARTIVLGCKNNGDQWAPFDFEEYKSMRPNPLDEASVLVEKAALEKMVQNGYLLKAENKYSVTEHFLQAVSPPPSENEKRKSRRS